MNSDKSTLWLTQKNIPSLPSPSRQDLDIFWKTSHDLMLHKGIWAVEAPTFYVLGT
jgi:hypothetical protein